MNILHRALTWAGCALALLLASLSATTNAQTSSSRTTILAVDASETKERLSIRIKLSAAPETTPNHFLTLNPARLIVDLTATDNATETHKQQLGLHALRSYSIVQSQERSRLVFNLTQAHTYSVDIEGDVIVIGMDAPIGQKNRAPSMDAPRPPGLAQLKNIDFRRGTQGEGRIVVDLSGPAATLDVRRQDKQLLVQFINAALPISLQQRLDVGDFGTPVRSIRTMQEGANVRMQIDAEGAWEYNAYQKDSQLVIELQSPIEQGKRAQQSYRGDRLSLQFQNIEVRAVLQVLADFTGLNIITSDSVGGALTLRLKDVPWDQALDIILQARGLDMRRNGNVIWIAPHQELLAKERLELEQRAQIAELEPVRAEVFQLNYQKADAFRKVFGISEEGNNGSSGYSNNPSSERRNNILSTRGSAVVDQRTNQLFVTDTPTVLANIRKLLEKVDIAARQVLIEARIVEADDSFSRNLGARLGFAAKAEGIAIGNTYESVGELAGLTPATTTSYGAHQAVNLPARAGGGANAGSFALSLFNSAASRFLSLELSALEADGKGKIVSSPRVVTADQQAALIEQGEEIPYQQATSSGATSTAFKKANLKLEVTPQITPDGNVILNVDINKDSRGTVTPGGLAINTKHVKTLVQVENGGTVVIGGIYTQTESHAESKVPLLGDIPVLGHLFKSSARIDNKTELLIFLTPKIVLDSNLWR